MTARNIKAVYAKWVADQQFTHALTFKPNNPRYTPTIDFLRRKLLDCHAAIDRKLLGRNFNKSRFTDRRTLFVAAWEGFPDCGHLHIMAKVHGSVIEHFNALCEGNQLSVWNSAVAGGTSRVYPISDATGWAHYALKNIWHVNDFDRIIILPEAFHNA